VLKNDRENKAQAGHSIETQANHAPHIEAMIRRKRKNNHGKGK